MAFDLFLNAALTTPVTTLTANQDTSGATSPVQFHLWLGSTTSSASLRTLVNPGTDQIQVSVSDSTVGVGALPTYTKLSLTQGGLSSATAGSPLNLGTAITGGTANAVNFWLEVSDTSGVQGTKTDLSLTTNTLGEL
jgi:hypothetical protein